MSAVLAPPEWRTSEGTVPLIDVQRTAGLSGHVVDYAIQTEVIPVVRQGGSGNARYVDLDVALMIVAAASLASFVGGAFVTVLRAILSTGGRLTDAGELLIPVRALAVPLAPCKA